MVVSIGSRSSIINTARKSERLLRPATITDRSDGRLVHLDGLNLSRAWCMQHIAAALPADDPFRIIVTASARAHALTGMSHIASGNYMGEHWLATFAVYLLSGFTFEGPDA